MKRNSMYLILCTTILSLLLAACTIRSITQPPTPTPHPPGPVIELEAINRLDAKLARMTQDGTFTGAVLIAQDGKLLLNKGYGLADRAKGTPNTPQTRFHLGSMTKLFTGLGILMLQEQGKLSVQDPICNYFATCPKEWENITIHHLLAFTSGLSAQLSDQLYRKIEGGTGDPVKPAEQAPYLGLTSQWTLDSQPGEQYAYNNFGFILLAHIIEEASGQSYIDYLKQAIFTPLEMSNTGYHKSSSGMAKLYANGDVTIEWQGQVKEPPVSEGAGDLYSSSEDLYQWDQALYGDQLMPKPELDRMIEPYINSQTDVPGLGYGNGWFAAGGGEGSPFATFMIRYPQVRLTVIVLINQGEIDLYDIWELIKNELF